MTLKEELEKIIETESVYPVFQPIVSLSDGGILGYEALSRLKKTDMIKDPGTLFKLAGLYSKLWDVEQLCRKKILKQVSKNSEYFSDKKVFMNVNPMVMTDSTFKQGFTKRYIEKHDIDSSQVVIEITEHSAVADMKEFRGVVKHYKEQGYTIAVDDAGSCYSGLNLICDVKPYYLKLDIDIIREICSDAVKCAMVKSFVEFANITGMKLIAEGIETKEQLELLIQLGVHYGQGYYLGKPDKQIQQASEKALKTIQQINYQMECIYASHTSEYRVSIMKIGKQKALMAYENKYGEAKCKALITQLEICIKDFLMEDEYFKWIDEDTTLLILEKARCNEICERIQGVFEKNLKQFYSEEELEQGYIWSKNKHGEDKKYSLVEARYKLLV